MIQNKITILGFLSWLKIRNMLKIGDKRRLISLAVQEISILY